MRFCALAILSLAVVLSITVARGADPPPVDAGGVQGLDLKTQLEKGLKARRPVEFAYLADVIELVEKGDLPRELVTTTFQWAQRQPTRRLQYFQFALQARARKLKLPTPDLSNQAAGNDVNGGQSGVTH